MMLLTNKKDILKAIKNDIEGASDSTISWLADSFNVPMSPQKNVSERKVFDRSKRVPMSKARPRTNTLNETKKK
jgi:hypothetical protein